MARDPGPAVVLLRMSPQLRDGLRAAATDAGCSLNAFAIQVLASAAGDATRFRAARAHDAAVPVELKRDKRGFPLDRRARSDHMGARFEFIGEMEDEMPAQEMVALVMKYDAEDPGFFVEWQRLRRAEESRGAA